MDLLLVISRKRRFRTDTDIMVLKLGRVRHRHANGATWVVAICYFGVGRVTRDITANKITSLML